MMCLYLCLHYVYVYLTNMCLSSNVYVIVTTIMKGVISYFPSPGVIHYVVSMCIPSEQEFGGSVETRRPNMDIPNDAIATVHGQGTIALSHVDAMSRCPRCAKSVSTPINVDMQEAMSTVWGTTCDSHAGLETSWRLPNDAIATVHGQGAIALSHVDDMSRCPRCHGAKSVLPSMSTCKWQWPPFGEQHATPTPV